MSTYRERREARAERLRGWAEKREAKAGAEYEKSRAIGDQIPFGQPILVGHHSERRHRRDLDRIDGAMRRSVESAEKAQSMASRADGIESQLEHAIYSDDHDAIERLAERIAGLEAERDRIKAYNATCRKGAPDTSILTDAERADLASVARHSPYQLGKGGAFPGYKLSNLNGNLNRNRKRLEALQRETAARAPEPEPVDSEPESERPDWRTMTRADFDTDAPTAQLALLPAADGTEDLFTLLEES